jgi:hypothetical protein
VPGRWVVSTGLSCVGPRRALAGSVTAVGHRHGLGSAIGLGSALRIARRRVDAGLGGCVRWGLAVPSDAKQQDGRSVVAAAGQTGGGVL